MKNKTKLEHFYLLCRKTPKLTFLSVRLNRKGNKTAIKIG
jgi:hypothetical protein